MFGMTLVYAFFLVVKECIRLFTREIEEKKSKGFWVINFSFHLFGGQWFIFIYVTLKGLSLQIA